MGINAQILNYVNNSLFLIDTPVFMCELGNQKIDRQFHKSEIAKNYFKEKGIEHVSIDINGRDGSLVLDLSKPITNEDLINYFNIITNFGSTEHIKNQYNIFMNMHNMCRVNGIFVHSVPYVNNWIRHRCFYRYSPVFFNNLATSYNYEVLDCGVKSHAFHERKKSVLAILRKTEDNLFDQDKFMKRGLVNDTRI